MLTYPLRFEPIFREYVWGGRRLGSVLHKPIGSGEQYAESWELVDHGADQTVVSNGPCAGMELGELGRRWPQELYGTPSYSGSFPLLFKFLDANQNLSIQVHPNDQQAARLDPPDLGKTEAWIVLHAEPHSTIYAGLKPHVTRADLRQALLGGDVIDHLHTIRPQAGDCLLIPAGTVHAIGAGLLVAEIQQSSDTTFRLFDWNRMGTDGKPRTLHIHQGLEVIDFDAGPIQPCVPQTVGPNRERLVACDKFVIDRMRVEGPFQMPVDGRFHILACLQGAVTWDDGPTPVRLGLGETALLPAACTSRHLHAAEPSMVLDMFLPTAMPAS